MFYAELNLLGNFTVLFSEVIILRNGICAVIVLGFKNIVIEGDNKIIIETVKSFLIYIIFNSGYLCIYEGVW